MTYPELILKMVEKLLEEKDKNYELQSKLEENKKSKDQNVSYIVEARKLLRDFFAFLFPIKNKKVCAVTIHIQVNNITHPEREYIV